MKRSVFIFLFLLGTCLAEAQLPALIPYRDGDKWGYADSTGKVIIAPQFTEVNFFSEGRAMVYDGKKAGYINMKGEIVIPMKYSRLYFNDESGEYESDAPFQNGMARARLYKSKKYGYIDTNGRVLIAFDYDYLAEFSEGLAAALRNKKTGFIGRNGATLIPFEFDENSAYLNGFEKGIATVEKNEVAQLIDIHGRPADAEGADLYGQHFEPYWCVEDPLTNKFGLRNHDGNWKIPPKLDWIGKCYDGIRVYIQEDTIGLIRENGMIGFHALRPTPNQYAQGHFANGMIPFSDSLDKNWGFIDKNGNWKIPPRYSFTRSFENGYAEVSKGKELCLIDTTGRELFCLPEGWFRADGDLFIAGQVVEHKKISESVTENISRYGVLRKDGSWFIPCEFSHVWTGDNNFYLVSMPNGRDGYIDRYGRRYWKD